VQISTKTISKTDFYQELSAMKGRESAVLTFQDVAEMLKVSPATVRRLWWKGTLPKPLKIGGFHIRWRRSDIMAWLEKQPGHELYDEPDAEKRHLA